MFLSMEPALWPLHRFLQYIVFILYNSVVLFSPKFSVRRLPRRLFPFDFFMIMCYTVNGISASAVRIPSFFSTGNAGEFSMISLLSLAVALAAGLLLSRFVKPLKLFSVIQRK